MRHDFATRSTTQTALLPAENRALLEQYLANPQEALLSELIQRLAPMVYGVCQRQLGSGADADDAFQACFLVVVRRLKDLATKNNLAGWVHGIAFRVARKARQTRYQHTHRLHVLATMPKSNNSTDADKDLKEIIDSEVARLPAPYREAVALCELQEKTLDEAAKELGWPVGTVAGRLSRARAMLKTRLARHGFTAIAVTTFLQTAVSASPSEALLERTVQSAVLHSQHLATGSLVAPQVVALAQSAEAAFFSSKAILLSVLMSIGLLAGGWLIVSLFILPARNVQLVMTGNTAFAVDAYKKMRTKEPGNNLLFSPFSLTASICLLGLGTEGDTEREILQALQLPARESAHSGMSGLSKQLQGATSSSMQLNIANALFGDTEVPWIRTFLSDAQKYYNAPFIPVKFPNRPATSQIVNQWAQQHTNGMLDQLVKADIVDPRTCIACVSALSLEGKWTSPFDQKQTVISAFHSTQGDVSAAMMRTTTADGVHCAETPQAHVVNLSFQSDNPANDISMTLVIPKQIQGLEEVEKLISPEQLAAWIVLSKQPGISATIRIPRFNVCMSTRWRGPLEAMGMQSCFVPQYAHFTRMLSSDRRLLLSFKNQRTKLEFHENGCRAASIGMDENVVAAPVYRPVASSKSPALNENIIADRPFFFFIRHHSTGTILFMGTVLSVKP